MPDRRQMQLLSRGTIEPGRPDVSGAGTLGSLAGRLEQFGNRVASVGLQGATTRAARQGREAGLRGEAMRGSDFTPTGRAFTQANEAAYLSSLTTDIRTNVTMLEAKHRESTTDFSAEFEGFRRGTLEGVPEGLRPAVEADINLYGQRALAAISGREIARVKKVQKFKLLGGIEAAKASLFNSMRAGGTANEEVAIAEGQKLELMLEALVGQGVFTPTEADSARSGIVQGMFEQMAWGDFDKARNKLAFVRQWKDNHDPRIPADRAATMAREMLGVESQMLSLTAQRNALADRKRRETSDRVLWELETQRIGALTGANDEDGNPYTMPTFDDVNRMVDLGILDEGDTKVQTFRESVTVTHPDTTDPDLEEILQAEFAGGKDILDTLVANKARVSEPDYRWWLNRQRGNIPDAVANGRDEIKKFFSSAVFRNRWGRPIGGAVEQETAALREYERRVASEDATPQEIVDDLTRRAFKGLKQERRGRNVEDSGPLLLPRYLDARVRQPDAPTLDEAYERTIIALDAGEIDEDEAWQQKLLIDQWRALLGLDEEIAGPAPR